MRKIVKYISLLLSFSILIASLGPAIVVDAKPIDNLQYRIIFINENAYLRILDTDETVTSEYFEKGTRLQKAVLDKESGEIIYQEFGMNSNKWGVLGTGELSKPINTRKYNISDFNRTATQPNSVLRAGGQNFSVLQTLDYEEYGESYSRVLYGYQDSRSYREGNWLWEIGTALSVISVVLAFVPEICSKVISRVVAVAGVITSRFGVQVTKIDYYWVYKFKQKSPIYHEFICTPLFVYLTKHVGKTNTGDEYWETEYEKSISQILFERDDVLRNPGNYL